MKELTFTRAIQNVNPDAVAIFFSGRLAQQQQVYTYDWMSAYGWMFLFSRKKVVGS